MKILKWIKHLYRQLRWTFSKDLRVMEKDIKNLFSDIQCFLRPGGIIDDITILVNNRWFLITSGTHTQIISNYFPVSDICIKERIDYLVEKYPYIGQISITKNNIMLISNTYNLIRFEIYDND